MHKPTSWKAKLLEAIDKIISGLIPPVPVPIRIKSQNKKNRR
jgi:hypothetical protein